MRQRITKNEMLQVRGFPLPIFCNLPEDFHRNKNQSCQEGFQGAGRIAGRDEFFVLIGLKAWQRHKTR